MNAVLDFPTLHAEPPAVEKTNAIAAGIVSVQGEVAKFDQIAAGLAAIEAAHPKDVIVAEIATPAGMKVAEGAWRAYRNPRLEVERARKAAKAPVLALGKAIDAFAGTLEERLREGEDHYRSQIDAEDARRAAIKAEQERIEREAAERHAARLAAVSMYALRCQEPGMTADRIALGIGRLEDADMSDPDNARAVELADMQCRTLETMWTLHAQAIAREAEAARQEAIRAENERQAAINAAESARIAAEAAAIRRQAEELAAQRAESERLEALAMANREHRARVEEELNRARATLTAPDEPVPTGTPAGHLLQDMSSGLSQALSSKPDAMQHAREAAQAIAQATVPTVEPEPATLRLGTLRDRLQFVLTEAFVVEVLGIEPAARERSLPMFRESQWPGIKAALVQHIEGLN